MKHPSYIQYLKINGYASSTIRSNQLMVLDFLSWLDQQNMEAENVRSTDMLGYMKYAQQREFSQVTIQRYINAIRLYFEYLKANEKVVGNPVAHISIKGVKRKKIHYIYSPEQLHGIYSGYNGESLKHKRNKVLLGLLVYQGIATTELYHLQVSHVKLREGKIEVPSTRRTNGRTIKLDPNQILDLYDYVNHTRTEILAISKEDTSRLLVSELGGQKISNYVYGLIKELKRTHKELVNAQQLRASVIVKWLKQYNLREAQYRAGHRYVSSTEGYLINETESLATELEKFHPLN